jgi:hypothetical protein
MFKIKFIFNNKNNNNLEINKNTYVNKIHNNEIFSSTTITINNVLPLNCKMLKVSKIIKDKN